MNVVQLDESLTVDPARNKTLHFNQQPIAGDHQKCLDMVNSLISHEQLDQLPTG